MTKTIEAELAALREQGPESTRQAVMLGTGLTEGIARYESPLGDVLVSFKTLEGTPENPGPGVLKGSPCSYTPPADGLPTPGDPLPCADLSVGPFGGPAYGPPNVATSDPNVHGPQPSPGVPAAAIPGQISPPVPGADMPLPPAPPGARTVPVGPQPPLPPDFTPGIAPLPPALPAPAVPGPGQQLPPANTPPLPGNPPFLPPLSQGQGG